MPQKSKIAYFEYGKVYPPPLVDGTPPVVPEPDAPPPRGVPWWAMLWYIMYASIIGAAALEVLRQPPTTSTFAGAILGIGAALLLWAITLFVHGERPATDSDMAKL